MGSLVQTTKQAATPEKSFKGVKKLSPKHRIALHRYFEGIPVPQIAEELGYNKDHLYDVVNSPVFQEAYNKLIEKADNHMVERIKTASTVAMNLIEDVLLDDEVNLEVRLKTAESMMDRAGHSPKSNSGGQTLVQTNIINLIERAYDEKIIDITAD